MLADGSLSAVTGIEVAAVISSVEISGSDGLAAGASPGTVAPSACDGFKPELATESVTAGAGAVGRRLHRYRDRVNDKARNVTMSLLRWWSRQITVQDDFKLHERQRVKDTRQELGLQR